MEEVPKFTQNVPENRGQEGSDTIYMTQNVPRKQNNTPICTKYRIVKYKIGETAGQICSV